MQKWIIIITSTMFLLNILGPCIYNTTHFIQSKDYGIEICIEDSKYGPRVAELLEGTPAYYSGLQVGDIIKKVNWWYVMSSEEAHEKLRGRSDSPVEITVLRNGEMLKYKVPRRYLGS